MSVVKDTLDDINGCDTLQNMGNELKDITKETIQNGTREKKKLKKTKKTKKSICELW